MVALRSRGFLNLPWFSGATVTGRIYGVNPRHFGKELLGQSSRWFQVAHITFILKNHSYLMRYLMISCADKRRERCIE